MRRPVTTPFRRHLPTLIGRLPRAVNVLLVVLCLAWIVNPFDFDWVPVLGWIDDAAAAWFAWLNVQEVVQKSATARATIPGSAKRIDD